MKKIIFVYLLLSVNICHSQNVGIGTTTPGFPLNFATIVGDKISLYGNSGNHYGLGVQSGLLQIHSDAAAASIAFGYGSSLSFTERMRIINTGEYGMQVNGRILLRNGTIPINTGFGPGIWLTRPDNTATLGFLGAQNNQNIGFYGGPAGWGLTYDAVNSRVGIGNQNPNAPLSFPASLGKKITLYPGASGNVGLGVYGNELRIHTDYEPADITFGYENLAGVFTERMRVKGNGGIAVNGNTGVAGQVLMSNGNGSPQWINQIQTFSSSASLALNNTTELDYPSAANITYVAQRRTKLLIFCEASINLSCTVVGPCHGAWGLTILNNGTEIRGYTVQGTSQPGALTDYRSYGPIITIVEPGNNMIHFRAVRMVGQAATPVFTGLKTTIIAIPE